MTTGPTARQSHHGLSASVGRGVPGPVSYRLDGHGYTAAAVSWLVAMNLLSSAGDPDSVATSVPDARGVTTAPALAGLGAPYRRPSAAGTPVRGADPGEGTVELSPVCIVRATRCRRRRARYRGSS